MWSYCHCLQWPLTWDSKILLGLERQLNSQEHLLLFQRTWFQFLSSMMGSSQSLGPMVLSDLCRHLHTCNIHSNGSIHIHTNINKIFFKRPYCWRHQRWLQNREIKREVSWKPPPHRWVFTTLEGIDPVAREEKSLPVLPSCEPHSTNDQLRTMCLLVK